MNYELKIDEVNGTKSVSVFQRLASLIFDSVFQTVSDRVTVMFRS